MLLCDLRFISLVGNLMDAMGDVTKAVYTAEAVWRDSGQTPPCLLESELAHLITARTTFGGSSKIDLLTAGGRSYIGISLPRD